MGRGPLPALPLAHQKHICLPTHLPPSLATQPLLPLLKSLTSTLPRRHPPAERPDAAGAGPHERVGGAAGAAAQVRAGWGRAQAWASGHPQRTSAGVPAPWLAHPSPYCRPDVPACLPCLCAVPPTPAPPTTSPPLFVLPGMPRTSLCLWRRRRSGWCHSLRKRGGGADRWRRSCRRRRWGWEAAGGGPDGQRGAGGAAAGGREEGRRAAGEEEGIKPPPLVQPLAVPGVCVVVVCVWWGRGLN